MDLLAAKQALEMMREAREQRGGKKPLVAFVPSKVIQGTVLWRELPQNLADLGEKVLPGISQRIAVAESVLEGWTIREYFPESESVEEFKNLAKAVERMVKP